MSATHNTHSNYMYIVVNMIKFLTTGIHQISTLDDTKHQNTYHPITE